MLKRILTGAIGFLIVSFVLFNSGIFLNISIFFCSMLGLKEIYQALSKKFLYIHTIGYLISIVYLFFLINKINTLKFIILFGLFTISILIFLVFRNTKSNIQDCMITLFGVFYITFLLSFVILIRNKTNGNILIWLVFISSWGCDTFAYFTGKLFGKHKLTEKISPKKTIEGSIGGSLGVLLISWSFVYFFNLNYLYILVCFIASIFSQFGDLAASAIKRNTSLKDYGIILPGHGGFLDRFDSVLFAAPIIYFLLYIMKI
ncbi:MAG: phosphatidate cytidylyltransferase [Clostridiales bacterium]|nr:phosphatidate cytidylyltransferase [Clostridiales bacterium]